MLYEERDCDPCEKAWQRGAGQAVIAVRVPEMDEFTFILEYIDAEGRSTCNERCDDILVLDGQFDDPACALKPN